MTGTRKKETQKYVNNITFYLARKENGSLKKELKLLQKLDPKITVSRVFRELMASQHFSNFLHDFKVSLTKR